MLRGRELVGLRAEGELAPGLRERELVPLGTERELVRRRAERELLAAHERELVSLGLELLVDRRPGLRERAPEPPRGELLVRRRPRRRGGRLGPRLRGELLVRRGERLARERALGELTGGEPRLELRDLLAERVLEVDLLHGDPIDLLARVVVPALERVPLGVRRREVGPERVGLGRRRGRPARREPAARAARGVEVALELCGARLGVDRALPGGLELARDPVGARVRVGGRGLDALLELGRAGLGARAGVLGLRLLLDEGAQVLVLTRLELRDLLLLVLDAPLEPVLRVHGAGLGRRELALELDDLRDGHLPGLLRGLEIDARPRGRRHPGLPGLGWHVEEALEDLLHPAELVDLTLERRGALRAPVGQIDVRAREAQRRAPLLRVGERREARVRLDEAQARLPEEDLVGRLERVPRDLLPVHADAVRRAQVLDDETSVLADDLRVAERDPWIADGELRVLAVSYVEPVRREVDHIAFALAAQDLELRHDGSTLRKPSNTVKVGTWVRPTGVSWMGSRGLSARA